MGPRRDTDRRYLVLGMTDDATSPDVVIIGAGLAGLTCAKTLTERGLHVRVVERDDDVGGRVRTDLVDGFTLDRGFQILLTGYPELRRHLDLARLELRPFDPGARVFTGRAFETIADPLRAPSKLLPTLAARCASVTDKLRILALRRAVSSGGPYDAFARPAQRTRQHLERAGFSHSFLDAFFTPFLGGVFLESELETSSRFFEFVFRMFSEGDAAVPAKGMMEIPRQLAAALPHGIISLRTAASEVRPREVVLEDGRTLTPRAVVVACEAPAAARLLPSLPEVPGRAVTCLYFDAPAAPCDAPVLHLEGRRGVGPVNNAHVASAVSEHVAPPGRSLVSVTCLGRHEEPAALRDAALAQLRGWFGEQVTRWRHLRTYDIPFALPAQPVGALEPPRRPVRVDEGLYVCGDHLDQASIDGAMVSGRRAAEAVLTALSSGAP